MKANFLVSVLSCNYLSLLLVEEGFASLFFSLLENAIWYIHLQLRGMGTINNNSSLFGFVEI